ncbi:hypothetical protein ACOX9X_06430 [Photobacterium leiognathi subsp. mandapamensis]|uniref:hypothetical protein n=1 Tax=Photobacterium leiognathi TaxID=553611 RepID=UPI003BF4A2CB
MLWDIGNKKSVQGVITGELLPLTNNDILVNQNGIDFIVNIETDNMKIKHSPSVAMHDPFLSPYSPTVFINDIGLNHVLLIWLLLTKTYQLIYDSFLYHKFYLTHYIRC